jgi:hypothetical protein
MCLRHDRARNAMKGGASQPPPTGFSFQTAPSQTECAPCYSGLSCVPLFTVRMGGWLKLGLIALCTPRPLSAAVLPCHRFDACGDDYECAVQHHVSGKLSECDRTAFGFCVARLFRSALQSCVAGFRQLRLGCYSEQLATRQCVCDIGNTGVVNVPATAVECHCCTVCIERAFGCGRRLSALAIPVPSSSTGGLEQPQHNLELARSSSSGDLYEFRVRAVCSARVWDAHTERTFSCTLDRSLAFRFVRQPCIMVRSHQVRP